MNIRVKILPGFERFWQEYGYKIGRHMAFKAWEKNRLEEIADDVIQSISGYNLHLSKNPWKNKAHASTFLNQHRWQDEYPEAQSLPIPKPEDRDNQIRRHQLSDQYRQARDEGRTSDAAAIRAQLDSVTH